MIQIGPLTFEVVSTGERTRLYTGFLERRFQHEVTPEDLDRLARYLDAQAMRARHTPVELDHYQLLGVPRDATGREITHAYRTLARRDHPAVWTDGRSVDIMQRATLVHDIRFCLMNGDGRQDSLDSLKANVEQYIQASGWPARRPGSVTEA